MMDRELRDLGVDRAYRDHAPEVYRVAYGILRDPDDAMDATHEAYARAWERWEQYDSQRPLLQWLHGIVVHQALDQLRRRRVRRLASPVVAGRELAVPEPGGADPAIEILRRGEVERALDALKPDARAALVLRHYYGYDYAAIAAFLGTTSGSVGSILSRGHAALRKRLAGDAAAGQPTTTAAPRITPAEHAAEPPEVLP